MVEQNGVISSEPGRRRRILILCICSISLLIVGLDVTIVNVALPAIHDSFKSSISGLQWVIDAYTLVIASLLMLSGSTADRIGRRRVFQTGLVVFSIGSLLCALAPSLDLLIAARVLQAVGGSMLNPVAMSIIRNVFTDSRERAQAIGVWGAMVGVSIALGPVVGGFLVDSVGWRVVFVVNIPVGITAMALTALFVPESRAPRPRRFDSIGQVLVIGALASLTYSIIQGPDVGWTSVQTLSLFGASTFCFLALAFYELRQHEPLLEVRFFGSAPFSGASAIAILSFAAQGGFLFLNTIYLQTVRGFSPFDAGLCLLPMAAMTLLMAPLSGMLVGRGFVRPVLVVSGLTITVASVMLTQITATTPMTYLFGAYFIFGIGLGLINPPITNTAVSGMPASQAGVASAVASTSRQVGSTLGVAVMGVVAGGSMSSAIGRSFATNTHAAWWTSCFLGVLILILAIVTTTKWAQGTARATVEKLNPGKADWEHPTLGEPAAQTA